MMKFSALLIPFVLAGCSMQPSPDPPKGWATKAVDSFTTGLGEQDAKASCTDWPNKLGATCTVKMSGLFYKVYCYWPSNTCELSEGK